MPDFSASTGWCTAIGSGGSLDLRRTSGPSTTDIPLPGFSRLRSGFWDIPTKASCPRNTPASLPPKNSSSSNRAGTIYPRLRYSLWRNDRCWGLCCRLVPIRLTNLRSSDNWLRANPLRIRGCLGPKVGNRSNKYVFVVPTGIPGTTCLLRNRFERLQPCVLFPVRVYKKQSVWVSILVQV